MDIHEIIENYKTLPVYKLVHLARNPEGLPLELIPVLQKELLSRGEQEEALKLSEYLIEHQKKKLSPDDLKDEIQKRLAEGESMESIMLKFKENGVDVFDELNADNQLQENTFDYILSLKEKGVPDEAIQEKLQNDFLLTEEEVAIINQRLKTKGRNNLVIGYALVVVIVLLFIISGGRIGIGSVIVLGIGIWRIYEGHSILNKA